MATSEAHFWAEFELTPPPGVDVAVMARGIALEQTVELDESLVTDPYIRDHIVGRVGTIHSLEAGRYKVRISYDVRTYGGELPQFLNVLFGNISLKPGIRIRDCQLQGHLFPGPRFGISGLRQRCGEFSRPLLCTALKPMGSSADHFARMASALSLGGLHILKDDHGLANQPFSPFRQRVGAVMDALGRARQQCGAATLYFPHFAPRLEDLDVALAFCRDMEVGGLLVCPGLVGYDMVRYLRAESGLPLMLHPAWTGTAFAHPHHGIAPPFLLGKWFRALGADAAIYPNAGGRFVFDLPTCHAINRALRTVEPGQLPAFPVPAGGMGLHRVVEMRREYGEDLILLMGSGLFRLDADLSRAVKQFKKVAHGHLSA